jgi:hypothetical protein
MPFLCHRLFGQRQLNPTEKSGGFHRKTPPCADAGKATVVFCLDYFYLGVNGTQLCKGCFFPVQKPLAE